MSLVHQARLLRYTLVRNDLESDGDSLRFHPMPVELSFVAQGDHWIYLHCFSGGDIAGQQCDGRQQKRDSGKGSWIGRPDPVQEARHQPSRPRERLSLSPATFEQAINRTTHTAPNNSDRDRRVSVTACCFKGTTSENQPFARGYLPSQRRSKACRACARPMFGFNSPI